MFPLILLVDDSDVDRYIMRRSMEVAGISADWKKFQNPIDALAYLSQPKNPMPNLIITDMEMPEMPGLQLIEQIKTLPHVRNIPLIVISNRSDDDFIKSAKSAGAVHYFIKPITGYYIREIAMLLYE